jgi:hypothetical protein
MNRSAAAPVILILLSLGIHVRAANLSELTSLVVEDGYRAFLSVMPLQLESGGARIFKLQDGSLWLVSIGCTLVNPTSSSEVLRRHAVAKAKAQANAVAELNGTLVKVTTVLSTAVKITNQSGIETGATEESLDETFVTSADGVVREMPVIGTWMNMDQSQFFIALGKRLR